MPADVIGTAWLGKRRGRKSLGFNRAIFTNLLLADEINRATPKTQSALLEAIRKASHGSPYVHQLERTFL